MKTISKIIGVFLTILTLQAVTFRDNNGKFYDVQTVITASDPNQAPRIRSIDLDLRLGPYQMEAQSVFRDSTGALWYYDTHFAYNNDNVNPISKINLDPALGPYQLLSESIFQDREQRLWYLNRSTHTTTRLSVTENKPFIAPSDNVIFDNLGNPFYLDTTTEALATNLIPVNQNKKPFTLFLNLNFRDEDNKLWYYEHGARVVKQINRDGIGWPITPVADNIIQTYEGDFWYYDPTRNREYSLGFSEDYKPYTMVDNSLIEDKDGDFYYYNRSTRQARWINNLSSSHRPYIAQGQSILRDDDKEFWYYDERALKPRKIELNEAFEPYQLLYNRKVVPNQGFIEGPTLLTASPTSNSITFNWQPSTRTSVRYYVQIEDQSSSKTPDCIKDKRVDTTTYTKTGLGANKEYKFAVCAYDDGFFSYPLVLSNVRTAAVAGAPSEPTWAAAVATHTMAKVVWTASTASNIHYRVSYQEGNVTGNCSSGSLVDTAIGATYALVRNLKPNTLYTFFLCSVNSSTLVSSTSKKLTATTAATIKLTNYEKVPALAKATMSWLSAPQAVYRIDRSSDLQTWMPFQIGINGAFGNETTTQVDISQAGKFFFSVVEDGVK